MIDGRAFFASASACILLAGCGPSAKSPTPVPPPIAEKPDVIITFDGQRHACVVALYSEPQGSAISCDEVVAFLKTELRVPSGSIYDVRTIPDVEEAEMTRVQAKLNDAGYRFIGGPHAFLLTAPHK